MVAKVQVQTTITELSEITDGLEQADKIIWNSNKVCLLEWEQGVDIVADYRKKFLMHLWEKS